MEDYSYKSLLSGKYYRFLPSGRTADLDCVIPDIHCLPDEVGEIIFVKVSTLSTKIFGTQYFDLCVSVYGYMEELHVSLFIGLFDKRHCQTII